MALLSGDERGWLRAARAGSVSDLETLFRLHWPRAYRAAYLVAGDRSAAESIAQEGFLAAIRNLDRFDSERPFGPWLHRTVVSRAIDSARARSARRETDGESYLDVTDPLGWPGAGDNPHPHLGPGPRAIAVGLALLPPEQRAVVVLRHVLEYSPSEIAEMLELPRGAVTSRLRRGLEQLEERLREAEG
jgi:RNA polymerase sigma-70 factor (ECF subfamily)